MLLERARAAGVDARRDDRHRDRVVPARARDRGVGSAGVVAALGIDPHRAATPEAGRVDELRDLLEHPRAVAVGETGLDGHHGSRTLREQRVLLRGAARARGGARAPGRDPQPRRERRDRGRARAASPGRDPPLLLRARRCSSRRSSAATTSRSPATSRTRRRRSSARRPRVVPADRILAETDSPYLAPQPVRGRPNEPMHVRHTLAALAAARGVAASRSSSARIDENAERGVRARSHVSRVTPKKALGQHFLVDRNVLRVIERLAALDADDVVLEVGPGLGVLTTFLADRVRHVHAVEIDRALEPPLRDALATGRTSTWCSRDALEARPRRRSSPRREARREPAVQRRDAARRRDADRRARPSTSWCVMVQREVADRFFAEPGTKAYGAVSVLVRLHARRTGFHAVSRTVFRPAAEGRLGARRVRADRFHRRRRSGARASSAPRSRTGARRSPTPSRSRGSRPASRRSPRWPRSAAPATCAREALAAGGVRRGSRRRSPHERVATAAAPAKINLALVVGPLREDGKHEIVTVHRAARARRHGRRAGAASTRAGLRRDTLVALALTASRPARAAQPLRGAHREADSGGRRARRRSSRRRGGPAARERVLDEPLGARRLHELAARARRRRAVLPHRGPAARRPGTARRSPR